MVSTDIQSQRPFVDDCYSRINIVGCLLQSLLGKGQCGHLMRILWILWILRLRNTCVITAYLEKEEQLTGKTWYLSISTNTFVIIAFCFHKKR